MNHTKFVIKGERTYFGDSDQQLFDWASLFFKAVSQLTTNSKNSRIFAIELFNAKIMVCTSLIRISLSQEIGRVVGYPVYILDTASMLCRAVFDDFSDNFH